MAMKNEVAVFLLSALAIVILAAGGCGGGGGSSDSNAPFTPEEVKYSTGILDESFGTGGIVTTPVGETYDYARAVAVQNDGKIVVAGSAGTFIDALDPDEDFALVRYNIDGTLDTSFGSDGKVTTTFMAEEKEGMFPLPLLREHAAAVSIQNDGKIVVAGTSQKGMDDTYDFALARYNAEGTPDTSFGSAGKVRTSIGPLSALATDMAIQEDGKIVVTGYAWNGGKFDFAVVRYNSDGSPDTTFGSGGIVTTPIGGFFDCPYAIAIQEDGKIVIAGYSDRRIDIDDTSDCDFAVVRYNSDGSLDKTFDSDGKLTTPGGQFSYDAAFGTVVQKDGKIVIAGPSTSKGNLAYALLRYNGSGTLDDTFGTGGIAKVLIDSHAFHDGCALSLQEDGKLVIATSLYNGTDFDFALLRFSSDGILDDAFGTDGIVTTPVGDSDEVANALAILKDGTIMVAGDALKETESGVDTDFAVVRYR